MGGVIFPRIAVLLGEVGPLESLDLRGDIALLRCISGAHLCSFEQPPSRNPAL
jgi:hypothetical protein